MKTTINFYEGSYQFDSITTELNVSPDFIEMKLAIQYEYRPTNESLWASLHQGSKEIARFKFEHGVGLKDITIEHTDDVKVNKIELASRIAHELLSTRFTAMGIIYEDEDMMEMDGDMSSYREPYQKHFDIEYCKVLTIIEEIKI